MILHVDMDAFYASVEEREQPHLKGKPLVVGGDPQSRGVVAAANYVARNFGIHSAMPMVSALRLCPDLIRVAPRMDLYVEVSQQLRAIFYRYTPVIEPLSLDEAFLDIQASERLFGGALKIARAIKTDVRKDLDLIASVGVAPNKFLAKLASDLGKPDGLLEVPAKDVQAFLDPLPVARLWGVGAVAQKRLQRLGVKTIADLNRLPASKLQVELGKWAGQLLELAHGVDHRKVQADSKTQSISHETTFDTDIVDTEILRRYLFDLTEQVASRVRHKGCLGATVHLKLRYGDFTTITRSHTLNQSSNQTQVLWQQVSRLFENAILQRPGALRLVGIGVSNLNTGQQYQTDIFDEDDVGQASCIDEMADKINDRFGRRTLKRGGGLGQ